jgi:Cu+-exporting ATPase
MTTDPVCGMKVSEQQARVKSEYKGRTYYFCSLTCKDQFDKHPLHYATQDAANA